MNIESKLEEIDNKIDRLQQIQDFTTLQTTFFGISFALFIFVVTALITNVNPLFKAASIIVLFYLLPILLYLFISIFSNNWETKLDYLNRVIAWIFLVFTSLSVLLLIFGLSMLITKSFKENNIIFVSWVLIVFIVAFSIFIKFINPRYKKRFNELYKMMPCVKPMKGILAYLDRILEKRFGKIVFSIIVGLFLTLATGYIQTTPYGETTFQSYGLPFSWLKYPIRSNLSEMNYPMFVLDMFFIAIIIFIIITLYEYLFVRKKKINDQKKI